MFMEVLKAKLKFVKGFAFKFCGWDKMLNEFN
jgi:hypothetical protein